MTTIPNLASLRLCGRNIRIGDSSITGTFAQAARYDKHVGVSFRIARQDKGHKVGARFIAPRYGRDEARKVLSGKEYQVQKGNLTTKSTQDTNGSDK